MCHSYRFCNDRGECFADLPLGGRVKWGGDSITLARARLHALLAATLEAEELKIEYGKRLDAMMKMASRPSSLTAAERTADC
jgi:hypothetical protein